MTIIVLYSNIILANASAKPFTGEEAGILDIIAKIDFQYVSRQSLWFFIGLVLMVVICFIDYENLGQYVKIIYIANVGFLLLLMIFGTEKGGAQGWFSLIGERTIQPSEFCKISLILMLGKMISTKIESNGGPLRFRDMPLLLLVLLVPFVIVARQPDLGTAAVYIVIFIGILFMAKTSFKIIGAFLGVGIISIPIAYQFLEDYQIKRLMPFLNAGDTSSQNSSAFDQVAQSKTMIGSGQVTGKGLFSEGTLTQLDYMPQRRTDFIFAVTAESVGFIGGIILLVLYFVLLFRLLYLASQAPTLFGSLIIVGVMSMLFFHIVENIGTTMGLLPQTGIPLPFFSYGGSNMLTNMIAIGFVQSVALRRQKKTLEPAITNF